MKHLEKVIAQAFLRSVQGITKTFQSTLPIYSESSNNTKLKSELTETTTPALTLSRTKEATMSVKPLGDDADSTTRPVDDTSRDVVLGQKKKKLRANKAAAELEPSVLLPAADAVAASATNTTTSAAIYTTQTSVPMSEQEFQLAKARLEMDQALMNESWIKQFWRPGMGWLYMAICAADFIIFPALMIFLPVIFKASGISIPYIPWKSLTLENGGMVHMAFGAILGVTAWTRGSEKIQIIKQNQ